MREISLFRNIDLILKVTKNINPAVFDVSPYEGFLESLCGERVYQQEAIITVCNYLFGGAYKDLKALAEENYASNEKLQEKYSDFKRMESCMEFPDRLACTIDMATGAGKSYVMYGIARIALAEGFVDRVLVLCPSNTIERGLQDKFLKLCGSRDHRDLMPKKAIIRNPHVINASETVTLGDICIENIHSTYRRTKSAIEDSFSGKGTRTLVLCDEAHHIYTPEGDQGLKKWKEFLLDNAYKFRYIVGLSGTCYIGDEYLRDVIHRYSLRQAIEDGIVKNVDYVTEDSAADTNEKLQEILANHKKARRKYGKVKPITVLVTKDIPACKKLEEDLISFLVHKERVTRESCNKKVLRVHTPRASGLGAKEDKSIASNVERLRSGEPDKRSSPVEWIVSVSMLTEGWDAHNVFQIVPHEERAFNSKLLVAQVLGRGLRVPEQYRGTRPVLTVFNHDAWSGKIKYLVDEVLEIERRIHCIPVCKTPSYDFTIHGIDYSRAEDTVEVKQTSEYKFDMEYVNLSAQRKSVERTTVYERAVTGDQHEEATKVEMEMISIDHVVADIHNKFKAIDLETDSSYSSRYPREAIRKLIRTSLDRIGYEGNEVSKENRQRILSSYGNLSRPGSKSIRYKIEARAIVPIAISSRHQDSVSIGAVRRGLAAIFYDDNSKKVDPDLCKILEELEADESLPRSAIYRIDNSYNFKTCLSIVISTSEPERKFIRQLVQAENAAHYEAWAKNADMGFYGIEYSYSRGEFSKRATFNPDFIIQVSKTDILLIEVKGDEEVKDPSQENKGKRKAAIEHFDYLCRLQKTFKYHFCFLCPIDYDLFFADLKDGKAMDFHSSLDVALGGDNANHSQRT